MSAQVQIGFWVEKESRDVPHSPSSYAADWETLRTRPGEYPAFLTFEGGYTIPMPYWVVGRIGADRIAGKTYNGFGGVNYSSNDLPLEDAPLYMQTYDYLIPDLIAAGKLRLLPGFEWLLTKPCFKDDRAPKTWDAVRALAEV